MIALYVYTGTNHFINPSVYLNIMPPWLQYKEALVFASGIFEIALALLLIFTKTRRFAAWGIIALLVAVFPANIQMMVNYFKEKDPNLWIAILRLPLQVLLIWWAYTFTKQKKSPALKSQNNF
jgi:uncharacterized membrane protein